MSFTSDSLDYIILSLESDAVVLQLLDYSCCCISIDKNLRYILGIRKTDTSNRSHKFLLEIFFLQVLAISSCNFFVFLARVVYVWFYLSKHSQINQTFNEKIYKQKNSFMLQHNVADRYKKILLNIFYGAGTNDDVTLILLQWFILAK